MKYRKTMIIVFSITGLLLFILLIGKINLSIKFSRAVKELFARSNNISDQVIHTSQMDSLPEPVQRYFSYILKDGQTYISYARIKHDGQFKTGIDKFIDYQG
jgi:hypothetical protein